MDYSGFLNFPFPATLPVENAGVKDFFYTLPDEEQLQLLNGCESFESFYRRVEQAMRRQ